MNWIIEQSSMNLKVLKEVVRAQRPSRKRITIQEMSWIWEVKGAAIEASASDNDTPTSAYLSAPQSFAPSPHIPTSVLQKLYKLATSVALSSGDILAQIYALKRTRWRVACWDLSETSRLKALPVIATE